MPLIGIIYSLFEIKWKIDQNCPDVYPKIKQSCVSVDLLAQGLEQAKGLEQTILTAVGVFMCVMTHVEGDKIFIYCACYCAYLLNASDIEFFGTKVTLSNIHNDNLFVKRA